MIYSYCKHAVNEQYNRTYRCMERWMTLLEEAGR